MTFGERLRKRRRELDMTQAELAEWVGHTQTCVSYWEHDRNEPGLADLRSLAEVLQITTDWLVLGDRRGILGASRKRPPHRANGRGAGTEGDASMQDRAYTDTVA